MLLVLSVSRKSCKVFLEKYWDPFFYIFLKGSDRQLCFSSPNNYRGIPQFPALPSKTKPSSSNSITFALLLRSGIKPTIPLYIYIKSTIPPGIYIFFSKKQYRTLYSWPAGLPQTWLDHILFHTCSRRWYSCWNFSGDFAGERNEKHGEPL